MAEQSVDLNNTRVTFKDFIYFAGIIIAVLGGWFGLKAEIAANSNRIDTLAIGYEFRIKALEDRIKEQANDIERLKYDNLPKNASNTPNRARR